MQSIKFAIDLFERGKFLEAAAALNACALIESRTVSGQLLRAELALMTGDLGEAERTIRCLLRSQNMPAFHHSRCEYILGKLAREGRGSEIPISHFQRSASIAQQHG